MAVDFDKVWIKKNWKFDNSMGSKDGCEVCELAGLYVLSKMKENNGLSETNCALYRDDLIAAFPKNGYKINRIKSIIGKTFEEENLRMIDWEEGEEMDYLEVCFNIKENSYKPFEKENANSKYINPHNDHPNIIVKQIPKIIEDRISMICSNNDIHETEKN